jgi:N-acetylglucosamine kinase-like BadF-type ATPase
MRIFFGVDAGGSKTHALVLDETGAALGFGTGGTGNHQMGGLDAAMREICAAVNGALQAAKVEPQQVELGCFCLAGADLPQDYRLLQNALDAQNLARQVVIKNDSIAALRCGLSRPWGVAVICGTGFNAAGRGKDGREIVLPGLGPISGDWGGGGDLVIEMIRAVMRAWDGRGKPTLLTGAVLDRLGKASEEDLLTALYNRRLTRRHMLPLAPLLFEVADAGDVVAREIVIRMGTEAGVTANALLRRLDLLDSDAEVVLSGSVFKGRGALLVDTVRQVVRAAAPTARIVCPRLEPVAGAALLALDLAGLPAPLEAYARLERAL